MKRTIKLRLECSRRRDAFTRRQITYISIGMFENSGPLIEALPTLCIYYSRLHIRTAVKPIKTWKVTMQSTQYSAPSHIVKDRHIWLSSSLVYKIHQLRTNTSTLPIMLQSYVAPWHINNEYSFTVHVGSIGPWIFDSWQFSRSRNRINIVHQGDFLWI